MQSLIEQERQLLLQQQQPSNHSNPSHHSEKLHHLAVPSINLLRLILVSFVPLFKIFEKEQHYPNIRQQLKQLVNMLMRIIVLELKPTIHRHWKVYRACFASILILIDCAVKPNYLLWYFSGGLVPINTWCWPPMEQIRARHANTIERWPDILLELRVIHPFTTCCDRSYCFTTLNEYCKVDGVFHCYVIIMWPCTRIHRTTVIIIMWGRYEIVWCVTWYKMPSCKVDKLWRSTGSSDSIPINRNRNRKGWRKDDVHVLAVHAWLYHVLLELLKKCCGCHSQETFAIIAYCFDTIDLYSRGATWWHQVNGGFETLASSPREREVWNGRNKFKIVEFWQSFTLTWY